MRNCIAAFGILSAAGAAFGQASFTTDASIDMSWTFSDNGAGNGNGNGNLDPGETALFSLTASLTNQFGVAHFSPPIGGITSGTILGLGSLFVDVHEDFGQTGTFNDSTPLANNSGTSGYGVRGGWRIAGNASNGTVTPTGIDSIQIGQFVASPALVSTLNPIENVFRFLWTPNLYSDRFSFTVYPSPIAAGLVGSIDLDLGNGLVAAVYVPLDHIHFASISQSTPGPGAAAVLAPVMAWATRRKRSPGPTARDRSE